MPARDSAPAATPALVATPAAAPAVAPAAVAAAPGASSVTGAPAATGPAAVAEAVLCPRCGYDLRGTTADRCGECGLRIDRAALAYSGFPWAHRGRLGRARAFLSTVWLVTRDDRRLRQEMAKPQDPRDAARFGRCVGLVLAVGMLAVWALAAVEAEGWAVAPDPDTVRHAVEDTSTTNGLASPNHGWAVDAAVPWAAGTAVAPVLPLGLVGLAFYLAGVPAAMARLGRFPPEHQDRGRAVARYAAAPLAFAPFVAAFGWAAYGLYRLGADEGASPLRIPLVAASALAPLTLAGAVLLGLRRAAQWRARAGHAGPAAALLAAGELVVRWAVGAAVFLGFFPWCVGYVWIVVASW